MPKLEIFFSNSAIKIRPMPKPRNDRLITTDSTQHAFSSLGKRHTRACPTSRLSFVLFNKTKDIGGIKFKHFLILLSRKAMLFGHSLK